MTGFTPRPDDARSSLAEAQAPLPVERQPRRPRLRAVVDGAVAVLLPLVAATLPFGQAVASNLGTHVFPTSWILRPMALLIVGMGVLIAMLRPFAGTWASSSYAATVFLLGCSFYPSLVSELGIGGAPPRVVAAAFVVFLLVTSVICGRAMKPPLPAVACLTLLVGTGLDVGRPLVQKGGSSYDAVVSATAGEDHAHAPVPELARDAPPDVYYIVTDGLARPDILRSRFGVDADPATDHLRRLGVTVIGRSRSNYAHTHLSLASSLNGVYIEPSLAATFAQDDCRPLDDLIRRGDMLARFRALGYEFVMVVSDTTITPGCDDSNWLRSQAFSG